MSKPFIQVDNMVREMTDEEYQELLDSGWTLEGEPTPAPPWIIEEQQ